VNRRTYGQHCGLAVALDLLGERWTLLVVRELLSGPRRFTDLLDGLPGVGTALLTRRLRDLEQAGVVERVRLQRPATGTAYALTADGRSLEPVVLGLAAWGSARLGAPSPVRAFRPRWALLGMRTRFDATAAEGVELTYELRVDDDTMTVEVADGRLRVLDGAPHRPDVVVEADPDTFLAVAADPAVAGEALQEGRLRLVHGDPRAFAKLAELFPAPATAA
jgi:DNA-binding HxlR family transcriptional regulator/putative sterol carrier protein